MAKGTLWYFANGRSDISGAQPATTTKDWRRTHLGKLQALTSEMAKHLAPPNVRALAFGHFSDPHELRLTCETIDTSFGNSLSPIVVAPAAAGDPGDLSFISIDVDSLLEQIASRVDPVVAAPTDVLIPRRTEVATSLTAAPRELASRIERDVTVVHRNLASSMPSDRVFGVDFRRGMTIEWSELAQNLDVERDQFSNFRQKIVQELAESRNPTIELRHEPSAGGTTLSRRLAWSLMEQNPVVLLNQFTDDTAEYLRDLFRFSGLPLLVVMEAEVITENQRERLLRLLRDDNTRAAFLWVSRVYTPSPQESVLPGHLSDHEAQTFLAAYLEQVKDPHRRDELRRLANDPRYSDQRSPFFFGLTAFAENFVGLGHLISDTIQLASANGATTVLTALALVSYYSGVGFPRPEFDDFCGRLAKGNRPFAESSPFAVVGKEYVRIPHRLIAERTLAKLARSAESWKADLYKNSTDLLDCTEKLHYSDSDRLESMINTLFVVRDTATALEADVEIRAGAIPSSQRRRFTQLIQDLGQSVQARNILKALVRFWPNNLNYAVHLVRHLLYEEPKEIEEAVRLATCAEQTTEGARDDKVVHISGQAYRIRMEQTLDHAVEANQSFRDISDAVRTDYERAIEKFSRAIELNPYSEYGHVASIQTATRLLQRGKELSRARSLIDFLRGDGRWCLTALSLAEERIQVLQNKPQRDLSIRAQSAIARWAEIYGNVDAVIEQLRRLSQAYDDGDVRRALCFAIIAKHQRKWSSIPQGDLRTIERNMARNIEQQGMRDSDVRTWFRAYRHLQTYDPSVAIGRLIDWHQLRERAVEPAYYLYVLYFLQWLNSEPRNPSYVEQEKEWIKICLSNRPLGARGWGYEWLAKADRGYQMINFRDLPFDPVARLRMLPRDRGRTASDDWIEKSLARVEGTVRDYQDPQQAALDLGQGLIVRFTPLERINRDDEGKRASVLIACTYDGPVGYDVRLL